MISNSPLVRRFRISGILSDEDEVVLEKLHARSRTLPAGRELIREGDRPEGVFLLLAGWACRYKSLQGGTRHILGYLVPGDLYNHHVFILKEMDHSIRLLSDAEIALISKAAILEVMERRPNIGRALLWSSLVDQAILREWLFNVGGRPTYQAVAHLLCELFARVVQTNEAARCDFALPITQIELAETMGVSPVHINRVVQRMRAEGLIGFSNKHLTIRDHARLLGISDFDGGYLHTERRQD